MQAGGIGLLHAVERFDAMQGATFATYAVQRIRGAMLDELRGRDWAPRSVRRQAREITKAVRALEQSLGRAATEQEIADSLQMDIAEYRQVL
ncbi:sigma-70 domain-containing protein, partial [Pseudoalteromonas sp. SIMBA_148]